MAPRTTITERVRGLVAEKLRVDPATLSAKTSFVRDLGADSLDLVELVMALEETFAIDIPDEDAERLVTIADAVDYILLR